MKIKEPTKACKPDASYTFYKKTVTVDFYEQYGRYKHIYLHRETGDWMTSVTGATGILDKPALLPWACKEMEKSLLGALELGDIGPEEIKTAKTAWRVNRDASADKGTIIHDVASQYILFKLGKIKKLPVVPKDPEIKNAYLAFRDWETTHNVKFIATEQLVYSKKYGFVGTLDCIAIVDGEFSLVDFKSGNGSYWDHVLQVSGYGIAYEEDNVKKFENNWIVRFGRDTAEFQAKSFKTAAKLKKGFLSALYLKQIQKETQALIK